MSDEQRPRLRDLFRPRPVTTDRTVTTEADEAVPITLRVAAGYAWRLLLIAAAIGVFIWLVMLLKLLVIPLMVGILITALLWPAFEWMLRHRFPRWVAILVSLLGTAAIVGGLLWLVIWQVRVELPDVQKSSTEAFEQFQVWLHDGPLNLSDTQIANYLQQGLDMLNEQAQVLWSGALAIGTTVGHVATGAVLALFILICLLADGAGIWRWTLKLFPRNGRQAVDGAARNGWKTVVNYARTQLFVATIDAVGIGLGAFLLQVPLALPVAVLVFLGSFIPIVGAVVTGAVAVFLALVYNGPWIALWMLLVVLAVQQLEGHILQPILMGSAVKVHPLAVVLVVAGGAMIAGIPGALFAVPLAAFINVAAVTLSTGSWRTGVDPSGDLIWSTVPRERRRRNQ
ncbi:AI-2E family transporter [Microbacterium sp. SSW1-49]|uniref:AI-2E family transporter n=1 Tax=Microbacterium croceum TaxID=2851645 RepID=A0ABT0FDP2_9MICO|nr:AI-2E family transporter [Microbacterium croceum]MCK2036186.1 AI-2E family transporter [Microbacterium croceum]